MKMTRKRLRKIIEEEIAHPRSDLGKNIADVDFPILIGYEDKSEIAYNQEELDNILDDIAPRGVKYSLDSLEDVEVKDLPVGARIEMAEARVTFRHRLLKIIKEEAGQPTRMDSLLAYLEDLPTKLQDTHTSIEAEAMAVEEEGLVEDPELMEMVDAALEILWGAMQEISDLTEQMERDGFIGGE
jgi:hypothetical protein